MATFFRKSRLWVVHYTWRGRARRQFKALPEGADGPAVLAAELADVHGPQARMVEVRLATPQEEDDYIHDRLQGNIYCPTGRRGIP